VSGDYEQSEDKLRRAISRLPDQTRCVLLLLLMNSPEERATVIGRLHRVTDGGHAAELLIDLEADRRVALMVADALKGSLPTDER